MRRQLVLAKGICEYQSAYVGLLATHRAALAVNPAGQAVRPIVVVPMGTMTRLRTELRLLLDRWDRDYPDATGVALIRPTDSLARAELVRAWLTEHVEELDALLGLTEGGEDT